MKKLSFLALMLMFAMTVTATLSCSHKSSAMYAAGKVQKPIFWGCRFYAAAKLRGLSDAHAAALLDISEEFWLDLVNDRKVFCSPKENDDKLDILRAQPKNAEYKD